MLKQPLSYLLLQSLWVATLINACAPQVALPPSPTIPRPTHALDTATAPPPNTLEALPPTITPSVPSPTLQLTFVSDRSGRDGIYAVTVGCWDTDRPCFGEPQLLFEWDKCKIIEWNCIDNISWSSDGRWVVFESEGKLFIADGTGENVKPVMNEAGHASFPCWSPDGTQIAFIFAPAHPNSEALDPYRIQVYEWATGQITTLFSDIYGPSRVMWLANGDMAYIAQVSEYDRTQQISIVTPDGTVVQQLLTHAETYSSLLDFDFSPNGDQLVFVGEVQPPTGGSTVNIYVRGVGVGDSDEIDITHDEANNLGPAWSPIGNWLAFFSGQRTGNYNIYLIRPDGSLLLPATQISTSDNWSPAWRMLP